MDKSQLRVRTDEYYDKPVTELSQLETRMLNLFYMVDEALKVLQPITASPTTIAPIEVTASVAEEFFSKGLEIGRLESTIPTTPPSSLSDTKTGDVGPVGPSSGCAHMVHNYSPLSLYLGKITNCVNCGVSMLLGWIPVPAAGQDTLTSPKPDSSKYAAPSVAESATSASNELTKECYCREMMQKWSAWDCPRHDRVTRRRLIAALEKLDD